MSEKIGLFLPLCANSRNVLVYLMAYYPQQMDLVKKAEEMKMNHADKHRKHRRKGPSSNDVLELLKFFFELLQIMLIMFPFLSHGDSNIR